MATDKNVSGNAAAWTNDPEPGDSGLVDSPGAIAEPGVLVLPGASAEPGVLLVLPGAGDSVGEGAEAGVVAVAETTVMATFWPRGLQWLGMVQM